MNEDPEEYLTSLIEAGTPPAAVLAEADRILVKADLDPMLLANVGIYASDSGAYDQAIHYFQAALDLRPDLPKWHYDLGVALLRSEQFEEARLALEKAVSLIPLYTYAVANLAAAYLFLDDPVAAALAFDRVAELYAEQPYPENVTNLGGLVRQWARSRDVSARLFLNAIDRWRTQDFEDGGQAFAELAAALPYGSPGRVIAEEHVALAAFMQDRHSEYLAGAAGRRELLACVQALTPRCGTVVVNTALGKDRDAFCHKVIKAVNPAYDSEGSVMLKRSRSPRGVFSREFFIGTADGSYTLIPIGNIIIVTDPAGEAHEITDYTQDHASLYNL